MKRIIAALMMTFGLSMAAQAAGWYGEEPYLRCNDDVRQAVYRGEFRTGYDHYLKYGQYENRVTNGQCGYNNPPPYDNGGGYQPPPPYDNGGGYQPPHYDDGQYSRIPSWFDERGYLQCNPDVARAVRLGQFRNGYHHYMTYGRREGRNPRCRG